MDKNGKKYGYSSVDNITGKKFNTESLFNFTPAKKKDSPMFDLNLRDPKVNIAGGQLRPKVRKNYIGLTFTKEFKKR